MSDLLIVTGPPGSGKSTIARLLAQRFERCALVEGDLFFGFVVRGYVDPWLPASHEQNVVVTEAAARATGRFPKGGYMTIYDGVVGPWFLPTFLEYSALESVHYAVLMPDVETCVARVLSREEHAFRDEPATRHTHEGFIDAAIEPRHVFADEVGDPASLTDEVRRYSDGRLVYPSVGASM